MVTSGFTFKILQNQNIEDRLSSILTIILKITSYLGNG